MTDYGDVRAAADALRFAGWTVAVFDWTAQKPRQDDAMYPFEILAVKDGAVRLLKITDQESIDDDARKIYLVDGMEHRINAMWKAGIHMLLWDCRPETFSTHVGGVGTKLLTDSGARQAKKAEEERLQVIADHQRRIAENRMKQKPVAKGGGRGSTHHRVPPVEIEGMDEELPESIAEAIREAME